MFYIGYSYTVLLSIFQFYSEIDIISSSNMRFTSPIVGIISPVSIDLVDNNLNYRYCIDLVQ